MRKAHNVKTERNEEIYNRRKAGETLAAIAKSLGLSVTRVRDISRDVERAHRYWEERNAR